MHDVLIIGGGFAGLLTAVELTRRGVDVVIVEQAPVPGGVAATVRDAGYLFEPAVGSMLLPHPHLSPILAAADVALTPAAEATKTRYVHTRSGLVPVPRSLIGALRSPLVSTGGKLRAAMEPLVRPGRGLDDETLEVTLRRRLGAEAGHFAATLMAHGVVAGDPGTLSTAALFPVLSELERDAGSITRGMIRRLRARPKGVPRARAHVHRDGMAGVTAALALHLGDLVRCEWEAKEVRPLRDGWLVRGATDLTARAVVLAVSPTIAASMLPPETAATFAPARSAPVAVVGIGAPAEHLPLPDAFGFLTAPGSPLRVLGVVFDSHAAPGRAPAGHHLAKAIYGGDADPDVLGLDDDALVDLCTHELGRALGADVRPDWHRVHRVHPGIPQYGTGHRDWLRALDVLTAASPGLHVTGWAYRGGGVSALATDAVRVADAVEKSLVSEGRLAP